jgi:hypothetical protein
LFHFPFCSIFLFLLFNLRGGGRLPPQVIHRGPF